jgi:hypothetical protein
VIQKNSSEPGEKNKIKKFITPVSLIFLRTKKKKPNYLQILGFLEERATAMFIVLVLYIVFCTN